MRNKSGKASPVVSLSKSGGTLKGRRETFAPDFHTGTGNLTSPLAFPPGTNEFQPELNLADASLARWEATNLMPTAALAHLDLPDDWTRLTPGSARVISITRASELPAE
jgi:hypothetical protein